MVHVDEAACSGCGVCVEACGYGVPQITGDGVMRKCDVCIDHEAAGEAIEVPPCVDTCPGTALILERVDRSEKVRHERLIQKLYGETRSV
jgi:Fe-S-cluster-containing dehydrogenase component